MIETQIIKENDQPIAVIMDYNEYQRLKEIEQDRLDYTTGHEIKKTNKNWTPHKDLKKDLGL
ncbi:MAG TPA: type II toxin-antitoxin system Phd/YefM family antitoxin [Spirochaetes bacterium]|nr:type II toxin-antitoxin system Phd/YefM family antitoxin [Spirochaetota bacterium]